MRAGQLVDRVDEAAASADRFDGIHRHVGNGLALLVVLIDRGGQAFDIATRGDATLTAGGGRWCWRQLCAGWQPQSAILHVLLKLRSICVRHVAIIKRVDELLRRRRSLRLLCL
ncbi:hypothetical protein 12C_00001 [Ralstonia phage Hennie]|uniref:Uncharacterized protein n=1 Tax=Ralstonia phage Hennie TaxID=2759729 RepID=A0A7G5BAI8_9CAUD|nr:hypothetical protein 12C_00001 [Ralstonia phage Hennie]